MAANSTPSRLARDAPNEPAPGLVPPNLLPVPIAPSITLSLAPILLPGFANTLDGIMVGATTVAAPAKMLFFKNFLLLELLVIMIGLVSWLKSLGLSKYLNIEISKQFS